MTSFRSIRLLALAVCVGLSLPTAVSAFEATPPGKNAAAASARLSSNFVSPDVTVTIQKGVRKRLLVAHVYAETVGGTVEGVRLEMRVAANGIQMEPGAPTRPFHDTKCTVGRITPTPTLELDASCIASGTFWLDLDTVDPALFIGQPIVVSLSTLALRFEDNAVIRDGFVSIVAELVKK
jgi:hypothetical protein